MRKLNFLILTLILGMAVSGLYAQLEPPRHLIISEIRWDNWTHPYVEYTNMHATDSVFLGDFYYQNFMGKNTLFVLDGNEVLIAEGENKPDKNSQKLPDIMLGPGESFVYMNVQDTWNGEGRKHARMVHSPDIVEQADLFMHYPDWGAGDTKFRKFPYIPEWQCWGFDSITPNYSKAYSRVSDACGLLWHPNDTVTIMVDQALAEVDWETGRMVNDFSAAGYRVSTAGIENAHDDFTLIRKFTIKEGETNWTLASGSDAVTSSWMLIPHSDAFMRKGPTTVGNHGDFSISYEPTSYVFDDGAGTVTVPWGTEKFDSITNGLTLGQGMMWEYRQNSSAEDSLSMICKDGDTLVLYACGNSLQVKKWAITVNDPLDSDKTVFGKRQTWYPDPESENYDPEEVAHIGDSWTGPMYQVDELTTVMDTVGFVPYATSVDTFYRLLEKPENASWEIVWKSGKANTEVSDGDILKVTAADASTKEYYIQVEEYIGSDEVGLDAITWPDRPEGVFMEGWGYNGLSDTLPGFSGAKTVYNITLPPGSKTVPVVVATTSDLNAQIEIDRAISLKGGTGERTTTIYITSETDTSYNTVKILWDVLNPDPQKFESEPMFARFFFRDWWHGGGVEISNPTDYVIDMSYYMVVKVEGTTKVEGIDMNWTKDTNVWRKRYLKYVPGYKWGNYTEWMTDPGWLSPDGVVNTFVNPKEVFTIWTRHKDFHQDNRSFGHMLDPARNPNTPVDVLLNNTSSQDPGIYHNPWNEPINDKAVVSYPIHRHNVSTNSGIYYLLKILNDSILLGTKKADDPDDFKVIDVMGSTVTPWNFNGTEMTQNQCWLLIRKPDIYYGDTILGQRNHLTVADSSQWDVWNTARKPTPPLFMRNNNKQILGSHALDPITGHLSIIYATVYKVSRGYSDAETLAGVSKGEDVATFMSNIIKADPTQMLKVMSGGSEKTSGAIAEGDILVVTSATGNVTKYTISIAAINGDASLVAKDTLSVSTEAPFEVGNFNFGASLSDVLGGLETADETVIVTVLDQNGEPVPTQRMNTMGEYADVVASADLKIEVLAEDGTTRDYGLVPIATTSDAYVVSAVYDVEEEPAQIIGEVPFGTGVGTFWLNIVVSEGADAKLLSATGQERVEGKIGFGDQVVVTSSDQLAESVYKVQFEGSVLAYVTSDVYTVDAETSQITGVPGETDAAAFLAALTPSAGSSMMLKDSTGAEKTTGNVVENDVVYVVSADGVNNISYDVVLNATSVETVLSDAINIYPNPVSTVLFVENIPADSYVRVVDITGRTAMLMRGSEISHGIDMSDLSNGVYMLNVEKDGEKLMTTRFVKK